MRSPAARDSDLGGSGGMHNFFGFIWVPEIDSDAISVV